MKKGYKLTVPPSQFIKELKDYNDIPYYSFLWNKKEKNKENDEWEVKERYVINVMNMQIKAEQEITITEILEAKPLIMNSKDKRQFLNCVLFVNAESVGGNNNGNDSTEKKENKTNKNNVVTDDDFPF